MQKLISEELIVGVHGRGKASKSHEVLITQYINDPKAPKMYISIFHKKKEKNGRNAVIDSDERWFFEVLS